MRAPLVLAVFLALFLGACSQSEPPRKPYRLVAGVSHACAFYTDDSLACWSIATTRANGSQISSFERRRARIVPNVKKPVAIALGAYHGCVVDRWGAVSCWMYGDADASIPIAAQPMPNIHARWVRSDGWGPETCAELSPSGEHWCWHSYPSRNWFGDPVLHSTDPMPDEHAWTRDSDPMAYVPPPPECRLDAIRAICTKQGEQAFVVELL